MSDVTMILQKVAQYIEGTQPQLDKVAADRTAFEQAAAEAVDMLVDTGVVKAAAKTQLLQKIAGDHTQVFLLMKKLAGVVAARDAGGFSLGQQAEVPKQASVKQDPYVRTFCPELVNKSGMSSVID